MTQRRGSQRDSASTPRTSPARRVWSDLIQPALVIGLIGAGAVMYLVACARLSVIECDLGRLERAAEQQAAVELELQRQLAQLQTAERIQRHIADQNLRRPGGTLLVTLTDVPPALYAALPSHDTDRERRDLSFELLASGAGGAPDEASPMLASARGQW